MNLLSETTSIKFAHTEVVRALQDAPVLDCRNLRTVANLAISRYGREANIPPRNVRRVRRIARGMINATLHMHDALHSDAVPDTELEELDITRDFNPVVLEMLNADDRQVDRTLKSVVENMHGVIPFDHHGIKTYMFRIATADPEADLVTEVIRRRLDTHPLASDSHPRAVIGYEIGFAGFEHDA